MNLIYNRKKVKRVGILLLRTFTHIHSLVEDMISLKIEWSMKREKEWKTPENLIIFHLRCHVMTNGREHDKRKGENTQQRLHELLLRKL